MLQYFRHEVVQVDALLSKVRALVHWHQMRDEIWANA